MDKNAIKSFAVNARIMLLEAVKQRAFEYEITEKGENAPQLDAVGGRPLHAAEKSQRIQLLTQISRKGFAQVMEEAAYTWFNRFIALRFMEVNGYLPSRIRVFTNENGEFKPDILTEAINVELDGLDRSRVLEMLDRQENDALYKYLLITQCNALSQGLPEMFETIGGWTELLFPANLLRADSIIARMVTEIPEDDWQVQIIGWLYQYYNTEPKDRVFADLKKNIKITKECIPAATQLFTPDWIVRYMVENSLGRLWVEGHPDYDKSEWKYYLEEAVQESSVQAELEKLRTERKNIRPEEIKVIDPCMGSGHILVYAFDVLMQIYTSCGWSERDAAKLILTKNLYGLDIDRRAYQLAYFSLMMKARQYNRRILNGENGPNLVNFQDASGAQAEFLDGVLCTFAKEFENADTYGSLMEVQSVKGLDEALDRFSGVLGVSFDQMDSMRLIYQILSQRYDVVITNPPYMGSSGMNQTLSEFVKKRFPNSKADLFACFIEKCGMLAKQNGYYAMITQHAWMFLSSYEKLRSKLMMHATVNMAHLGARAFDEIGGEVVQTTAFVNTNVRISGYNGVYVRLVDVAGESEKKELFLSGENRYVVKQENFSKIPGMPVAYWVSDAFVKAFEAGMSIDKMSDFTGSQHITANNDKYLRFFWEVDFHRIGRYLDWAYYAKGGEFRRWYGNIELVVNTTSEAIHYYKTNSTSNMLDANYWFTEGITYSAITSKGTGFRYYPEIGAFDKGGATICRVRNFNYILGLLNTKIVNMIFSIMNPTINLQVKDVKALPVIVDEQREHEVNTLVQENIELSKTDWDSFETSWEFEKHPLLKNVNGTSERIAEQYRQWEQECEIRFQTLRQNEEKLNRIFIDIYGLQEELTPEVEDKEVTIRRADLPREVKSLISYGIGCMFGRYSIDCGGLCYAGGEWDSSRYETILPDRDNIIPICDDDYFEDDLAGRVVDFIRRVYGEETLEENLRFIADALGGKGTPRQVIRSYLLTGFYADHCKIYQKRPVYWLFSSGKKNGFKALVYMHRYKPDLIARLRTDYVHEQQERYRTQIQLLEETVRNVSPSERVKLNGQADKLKAQALELKGYEEKIHHLADRKIAVDLNDGVKVNYAKFEDVLEKIK